MMCPCTSRQTYVACCKGFHNGKTPLTALELMRSRYSAYALKKADYIIQTTHPESPYFERDLKKWKAAILEFCKSSKFEKLEIIDFGEDWVHFKAYLGHTILDENSKFVKLHEKWMYLSGIFN